MKSIASKAFLTCTMLFMGYLSANDSTDLPYFYPYESFFESYPSEYASCDKYPFPWTVRLEGGYAAGKFIGIKDNYSEIGVFATPKNFQDIQPVVDLRTYRLDSGKWAASIGGGVRFWNYRMNSLIGTNLYYDYLEGHICPFHRLGAGVEWLGECLDARVNAYIPISGLSRSTPKCHFNNLGDGYFATFREREFAFLGVEAEIGKNLAGPYNFNLYGALGPYYYHNKHVRNIYGGYARLGLNWQQYIFLEGKMSYDNEYHSHFLGKILFSIPLERVFDCLSECGCNSCYRHIYRNGLIFTKRCCDWNWNW